MTHIKRHNTQWEMAKQSAPLDSVAITFDVVKRLWNLGYQAEPVTGTDGWIKVFELPDPIYDDFGAKHALFYCKRFAQSAGPGAVCWLCCICL